MYNVGEIYHISQHKERPCGFFIRAISWGQKLAPLFSYYVFFAHSDIRVDVCVANRFLGEPFFQRRNGYHTGHIGYVHLQDDTVRILHQ
ncbi:hypothetical protein GsuE55_31790 [Geobacillus subterraneus]|uniref:Uncharacterized protein n=1 Tax=Geobacillus subterraneus TaxID=129338 RepID=A0A679FXA6_9BACL|nr:hypothetical protein GsuE55_31790 [Geobacillus subterraneus]